MLDLPKAKNVFEQVGVMFDDENDKPVDPRYWNRQLPSIEEVQAFADGVDKTIVFFVAYGSGRNGRFKIEQKFLVKPVKLVQTLARDRSCCGLFCLYSCIKIKHLTDQYISVFFERVHSYFYKEILNVTR